MDILCVDVLVAVVNYIKRVGIHHRLVITGARGLGLATKQEQEEADLAMINIDEKKNSALIVNAGAILMGCVCCFFISVRRYSVKLFASVLY